MRLRHIILCVPLLLVIGIVGTSCAYDYKAASRSAELRAQVRRSAPTGATRDQVETSLAAEGLPYQFSQPSNDIISPWIPVGRFRLLWEAQFFYQIHLDANGRVANVETLRFNDGL
jgi:hypothetical protein